MYGPVTHALPTETGSLVFTASGVRLPLSCLVMLPFLGTDVFFRLMSFQLTGL
jgi:hypothetical protein